MGFARCEITEHCSGLYPMKERVTFSTPAREFTETFRSDEWGRTLVQYG
jgi:hypothetical protein